MTYKNEISFGGKPDLTQIRALEAGQMFVYSNSNTKSVYMVTNLTHTGGYSTTSAVTCIRLADGRIKEVEKSKRVVVVDEPVTISPESD